MVKEPGSPHLISQTPNYICNNVFDRDDEFNIQMTLTMSPKFCDLGTGVTEYVVPQQPVACSIATKWSRDPESALLRTLPDQTAI